MTKQQTTSTALAVKKWLHILCCLSALWLTGTQTAFAASTYTIADQTGDWGMPSPYAHYPRGPGYIRMSFAFDTLIWKDAQGLTPALASEWRFLAEENAYLFKLNDNVRWHDGQPLTAEDVIFTFEYIKKHPYKWVDASVVERIDLINDRTIKVILNKSYAPFLHCIAATMPILPEHIWKEVDAPNTFRDKAALIGSGPYKAVDYDKQQGTYRYRANTDYYQGRPKFDQIIFVKMRQEMFPAALRQGQINAAQIPSETSGTLEKDGFTVLTGPHDWVAKLAINHKKGLLANREFRRALAAAIDRQAIVHICQRGFGLPGNAGLLPPDNRWFQAVDHTYPYDPGRIGEVLEKMGYLKKEGFYEKDGVRLEFELLMSGGSQRSQGFPGDREAEMIQKQLGRAGVAITLRSLDSKTLDSRVAKWKFDLALSGHGGLGGDPASINRAIIGKGFNSARFRQNKELVSLLQRQVKETRPQQRKKMMGEIQQLYALEMPALPLYYPTWFWTHDHKTDLFYTDQGIAIGVPLPLNKLSFVDQGDPIH